jgi:hypothetical protein
MKQLSPIGEESLQALVGLIDAGIRATGIRAVKEAAALLEWLEGATDAPAEATQEA